MKLNEDNRPFDWSVEQVPETKPERKYEVKVLNSMISIIVLGLLVALSILTASLVWRFAEWVWPS